MQILWDWWLLADEPLGAVLGLVIVGCLIRQNMWAWPLGVLYVIVSITVLLEAKLYANLTLHVAGFLPMNLYGWYYWLFGKEEDQDMLPVTHASRQMLLTLGLLCGIGTLVLGTIFAIATDAALPFWDNGIFVGSLAAMWLTARKKIENWILWFVIDVLSVGVYYAQGLTWYAVLYFIYWGMAVAGYVSWMRSMEPDTRQLKAMSESDP